MLPIKAGLKITNPAIEENSVDLFGDFVKNSMNPSFATPEPAFFVKPGVDLPSTAAIDYETDTLVLKAQAVANDLGHISYVWKYKSDLEGAELVTIDSDNTAYVINSNVPVLVTDIVKDIIADENGTRLYIYRLKGNVEVGQIIKVKGAMATYNDARQITGGTFETEFISSPTEFECGNVFEDIYLSINDYLKTNNIKNKFGKEVELDSL